MLGSLWRQLVWKRMTRAAARNGRPVLRVEGLEDRTTPAGIFAVASSAGFPASVSVFDAATRAPKFTISPFPGFTGGVNVTVADVTGDGTPDVIVAPKAGGGSVVSVYSGADGTLLKSFSAGDDVTRAGASVAAADFDGDGLAEVVAGSMRNGQPLVQVYRFSDLTVLHGYTPFQGAAGVSVAAADVTGDGTPDVIAGAGPGGGPQVTIFDGRTDAVVRSFFAFESTFTGGVGVAAGDATGDGRADILVSAGPSGGPRVSLFNGATGAVVVNFFAYSDQLRTGVEAVLADSDGNGTLDIVATDGASPKAFDARTVAQLAAPPGGGLMVGTTDATAPTVTLTTTAPNPTSTTPLTFTATFSEAVNGFSAAGVTAVNGTVGNVTRVDGKTYTFTVTPTADGAVTVTVAAGAARDTAGNASTASAAVTRTFDATGAAVTAANLTTNDTTPTLTGTVADSTATVKVVVGGQTVTATVTGTNWSATLPTALGAGTYPVQVTSTDAVGNTATAAATLVVDTTAPTATVTTTAPEPTDTSPIPFTVTFSEDVTGFSAAGLNVTNGSISGFTQVDARTYTFSISPLAQGTVSVSVNAAAAKDAAGNDSAASAAVTRTFDSAGPVVTANQVTTNDTTPTLTGTVDESTATVTVTVGGQAYTATVTGTTWSVDVTTALAAGTYDIAVSATDTLGNTGTTTLTGGLVIDLTAPTATVATDATGPTNDTALTFTITFSEAVTGFTQAGLTVTGGTVASFTPDPSDATTYTVVVTPTPGSDGPVSVSVTAGAAADAAGNDNTASNTASVDFDGVAPTATVDTAAGDPTATNPIPFTVTFDEDVTGFTAAGLVVTGGTVTGFAATDARTYTFAVVPDGPGVVSVSVGVAAAQDAAGNTNAASAAVTRTFNGTVTTATVTPGVTGPTSTSPIPFTITFTDAVTGFDAADLVVTNGSVSNFVPVSGTTYTFDVTPTADGAVTVSVAAGAGLDSTSSPTAAASATITYDATTPTATVTAGPGGSTNTNPIAFTVTFDEDVTGFDQTGVTVSGGALLGFTPVDARTYTVTVTPAGDGVVSVSVNADAAQDAAGNLNPASAPGTITFDGTVPTVAVATDATSPTNDTALTFTITFSEAVTGFTQAGLTVTGGTVASFTPDPSDPAKYTVVVTPTPGSDGAVSVSVTAGAAQDTAGNDNTASNTASVDFDGTAPAAAADTKTTGDTTPTLTGTVDDPAATVTVTVNGQAYTATVTGTTWSVDVTTALAAGTYDIVVTATDALGNAATTTRTGGLVVDTTAPAVTISAPSVARTAGGPVTFTITYSDATLVTATLSDADITLNTTGTATGTVSVSGSGLVWTVTISGVTGDGTIGITVAAGTATDAAGNAAAAAGPSATSVADNSAPNAPAITGLAAASDTGDSATDEVTADPTPTITGTAEPGSTVEVFTGGATPVSLGTATADPTTGAWSLTPTTPLADGTYTLTAVATDGAGNDSVGSATLALVIDTADPAAVVTTASTDGVSGTAADGTGSGVKQVQVSIQQAGGSGLYWDQATQGFTSATPKFFDATSGSGGNFSAWSFTLPAGVNGTFVAVARTTDLAGNSVDGPATTVVVS